MKRLFDTGSQRSKAQLSLVANIASRLPSIIGILFFFPLIYRELGDAVYGQLMAAISLGSLASMLLGGGFYVGRRRIGEAMHEGLHQAEADAFITLMRASWAAAVIGIVVAASYAQSQSWAMVFISIAVLQISAGLTGTLDEVRIAYNELYVTASARAVLQLAAYAVGLGAAWVAQSPLLAALVIISPAIAASLFSTALLLTKRPYLLSGTGLTAWQALREGLPIGLVDGLLMMAVNLSVVAVQAGLPPEASAWYATIVRVFILALTLAMLLVLPMTSYLRGIWNQQPLYVQSRISLAWVTISIGFGIATALGLWLANIVYLGFVMGIEAPFPALETLAIYAGLGAVGTFKCFTAFGYIIMNTRSLNVSFGAVLLVSFASAVVGQALYGTQAAVQWCALTFALGIAIAIFQLRRSGQIEAEQQAMENAR